MTSIRQRLLTLLGIALTIATIAGAWSVYVRARAEARDLFDYQMQLMAQSFPDEGFGGSQALAPGGAGSSDVVVVRDRRPRRWSKSLLLSTLPMACVARPRKQRCSRGSFDEGKIACTTKDANYLQWLIV